jgi:hypothetical protein
MVHNNHPGAPIHPDLLAADRLSDSKLDMLKIYSGTKVIVTII